MAPNTNADGPIVEPIDKDYQQYILMHSHPTLCETDINKTYIYNQTLPKNEPFFMHPIRKWEKQMGFVTPIRWINLITITLFHFIAIVWISYMKLYRIDLLRWQTIAFGVFMGQVAGFGVTAGAHRYWSHRSYKATLPLKIILLLCYSAAGQNSLYDWVRDHRVHHKRSETSADPHDANRGFFFSHIGWLMMKKHPDVLRAGNSIDMSDITQDHLLNFHTRYFIVFKMLCCFIIPTAIPMLFWGETWQMAVLSQSMIRYILSLHFTWSVNSFAHLWGHKSYDRNIMPSENWGVAFVAMGEGWHNYHHTFPWDYKAAELPYSTNTTTVLLDFFATLGWAYDRKTAPHSLIKMVVRNRGDGTHHCT
ncbi:hypothetical protein ACJJTC_009142 [Scirpophaga incertulas]